MSFLFWALTFFLLDHGALNLGDGKVAENPENIASITSKEDSVPHSSIRHAALPRALIVLCHGEAFLKAAHVQGCTCTSTLIRRVCRCVDEGRAKAEGLTLKLSMAAWDGKCSETN